MKISYKVIMRSDHSRGSIKEFWDFKKYSKSRKQILKFSLEPKNEQKYFCISDLASKKRSNPKNKGTLYH